MDFERNVENGFIERAPAEAMRRVGIHCPVYFSRQAIAKHVNFSNAKRCMSKDQKRRFDDFYREVSQTPGRFLDIVKAWKASVAHCGDGARSVHEFDFMTYTRMGLEESSMVCVAIATPTGESVLVFMVPTEARSVLDKIS